MEKLEKISTEMVITVWRIYLKGKNMKTFKPMGKDGPVGNLIYALFYDNEAAAKKDMESLARLNPDYTWELRKQNQGEEV